MTIPKHIIKKFEETFSQYPSIIEVKPEYVKTDITKVFKRSRVLWTNEMVNSDGTKTIMSACYEYDPTGILVFINSENVLFILTTMDRKGVADFMINGLKFK